MSESQRDRDRERLTARVSGLTCIYGCSLASNMSPMFSYRQRSFKSESHRDMDKERQKEKDMQGKRPTCIFGSSLAKKSAILLQTQIVEVLVAEG